MADKASTPGTAILLISCPDRQGIIAATTRFIHENRGNVVDLEQHVDAGEDMFFMRLEWDLADFAIPIEAFGGRFESQIARGFDMTWTLALSSETPKMALFVSKMPHCLLDILARYQAGEWNVEVPVVISNHPDLESAVRNLGIDFHAIPVTKETKAAQEERALAILGEHEVDVVVLARYMQILSKSFIAHYENRIINIHHSFLPAFPGARPYHSAHERGVKIIGATSHYVTEDLDAGPIIEQDVIRVSHTDSVKDLIRKGRDLEKIVLSRAVWAHLQHKVLVFRNRTIVFV